MNANHAHVEMWNWLWLCIHADYQQYFCVYFQ